MTFARRLSAAGRRSPALVTAVAAVAVALATLALSLPSEALRAAAVALIVLAALEDLRSRRIRNALAVPALVLALFGAPEAQAAAFGALLAPAPLLALAVARPGAMGMGDVKLAAPAGALVGLRLVPQLWLAVALIGGVLALVVAVRRGRGATIPYGLAIAAGVALGLL